MKAIEIIEAYLAEHGYDGLCDPEEECGCGIRDLRPADCDCSNCMPAYRHRDGLFYPERETIYE